METFSLDTHLDIHNKSMAFNGQEIHVSIICWTRFSLSMYACNQADVLNVGKPIFLKQTTSIYVEFKQNNIELKCFFFPILFF